MAEVLTIKKLGPLKEARIEPRPLTVIIGPQASGKSLIAQCLYFFRGLESHLAKRFSIEWFEDKTWQKAQLKKLLDDLRKVAFGYFANGTASLAYNHGVSWDMNIYEATRAINPNQVLMRQLNSWAREWSDNPSSLFSSKLDRHIFIPTERSIFTRLADRAPGLIFDKDIQPYPFTEFAEYLTLAKNKYQDLFNFMFDDNYMPHLSKHSKYILERQQKALSGTAYVPPKGPKLWKWMIGGQDSDASPSNSSNFAPKRIIPIEATASGQTEAWPFFVVAAIYGASRRKEKQYYYFEEPETHLHPSAQVEVINTISYLVNLNRPFVVTTHSPFILYVINNLIMRYLASTQKYDDNKVFLNPDDVAVYSIKDGKCRDIMDREDTKLIPSTELDDIANQLGAEFDQLLDQLDRD